MSEIRCGACGTMTAVCDHVHADIEWLCARAEQAQADRTELLERALRAEGEVARLRERLLSFRDAEAILAAVVKKAGGEVALEDYDMVSAFGLELLMYEGPSGGRVYRARQRTTSATDLNRKEKES